MDLAASPLRHFTAKDGLPDEHINSIAQTFDGYLWLASPRGLIRYDGASWDLFDRSTHQTLADDSILTVKADRLGYLWVGTETGGLHRFDGVTFRPVSRPNKVGNSWAVTALLQESNSTLWIGTPQDLLRLEPTASASLHGLPGIRVNNLMQDPHGYVWASAGRGLFRQVQKTFQTITLPLGLETSVISSLIMLPDGRLAVGRQDGLILLSGDYENAGLPQTAEVVAELAGQNIKTLWVDHEDRLVVATADRVVRFNPSDGESLGDESLGDETSAAGQELGDAVALVGLGAETSASGDIACLFEDRENSLWIGTRGGGLFQLTAREAKPQLTANITMMELDGRQTASRPSVVLSPDSQQVAFFLSAPTFVSETRPSLHYRLQKSGAESEQAWVETDGGWARFSDLSPGSYTFQVETRIGEARWAGTREVTLRLEPKIHQTRKFWATSIGSLLAVGFGLFAWVVWQRRRAEAFARERAREWRELQEESGLLDRPDSPLDPMP